MNNLFRSDLFIKTALGPAVAGAQVWYCLQPSNVSSLPPSPLANVYSDPGGLVPVSQPLLSDGFGHVDAYLAPGLYTVIVAYGGKIQQVYPDQSIGNVGTSGIGSSIVFSTNGSPNFNQLAQNLVQGVGITLVTDNLGNTTITSKNPVGTALEVNGIPNGSSTLLNLSAGTGISIVDNGSGTITFTNNSIGISLPTNGFILGSQNVDLPTGTGAGGSSRNTNAEVGLALLVLLESVTVTKVSIYVITGSGAGNQYIGIYSYDGNTKLIDSGPLDLHTASQKVRTATFSAVTLPAGCYWFAWGNDTVSGTVCAKSGNQGYQGFANSVATTFGRAANTIAGSALPATLGSITAYAYADTNCNVPLAIFQ